MSRTGVGVRVTIDGAQLDDGCLEWASEPPPDALPRGLSGNDGLTIVWGRANSTDQPSPSTCAFRITDTTPSAYIGALRVGADVRVYAESSGAANPSLPSFADPGFETEVRGTTSNATLTRTQQRVDTGAWAAAFAPVNTTASSAVRMPPAQLEPPGGDPSAWDGIQAMAPGDTWGLSARLWVPPGVTVLLRPVLYTGPFASAAIVQPLILATVTGTGTWQSVSASFVPGASPGWLGVALEASPGGAWDTVSPTLSWDDMPPEWAWDDFGTVYLDNLNILAPAEGTAASILVFQGRVTDLTAAYDEGAQAPGIDVTASDFLAELGNRYVGAEPWLAEPLSVRMQRVLTLAAAPGELPITSNIAASLAAEVMTWEDVDHQAASGLLTDMAQSVDGVLWPATHISLGPYVRLEDPAARPALQSLTETAGGVIVIAPTDPGSLPAEQRPLELSACDMLRDPVTFLTDSTDIATRVSVEWQEQTIDAETQLPAPTSRTYQITDPEREAALGTRSVSMQSMLTTAAAAARVADTLLARQTGGWRASGLVVADADFSTPDQTAALALLTLLDGVHRGGQPLHITALPEWSPLGADAFAYVEGGEYTFTEGGWSLALLVSPPSGLGASAQWDQLDPTWLWDEFSPDITWDSLRGVSA